MKKLQIFIIVLFAISLFFSCGEDELNENFLWYTRPETGCADPWDTYSGQSDSNLKSSVKDYLNDLNIEYDKVVIGFDSIYFQGCMSCFCTTGRYIEVHAAIANEETLNGIGFFVIPDK